VALVVGAVALIVVSVAAAASVPNGSFESGMDDWQINIEGLGQWAANDQTENGPNLPDPQPPKGAVAAIGSQDGPSSNVLYQDVQLPDGMTHHLSVWISYNSGTGFATPHNLHDGFPGGEPDDGPPDFPNQQFRVDVMKPSAGLRSVKDSDVLKPVFRTEEGDETQSGWFKVGTNLDKYAGKTVRIRFVEVDNQEYFTVGVDGVKVKSS
jgi:hypothetical protein